VQASVVVAERSRIYQRHTLRGPQPDARQGLREVSQTGAVMSDGDKPLKGGQAHGRAQARERAANRMTTIIMEFLDRFPPAVRKRKLRVFLSKLRVIKDQETS
jgi:hypothetical protein